MILRYFDIEEFACKGRDCCDGSAPMNPTHLNRLEGLRAFIELPIIINSGFRCKKHNNDINGAPSSYHTLGLAADIRCPKLSIKELRNKILAFDCWKKGGVIVYDTFIHVDSRDLWRAKPYFKE